MNSAEQFAPVAYRLVASCKTAGPRLADNSTRRDLGYNADLAAKAIHKVRMIFFLESNFF